MENNQFQPHEPLCNVPHIQQIHSTVFFFSIHLESFVSMNHSNQTFFLQDFNSSLNILQLMRKNNVTWLYLHFETVLIGAIGLVHTLTVIQVKLQPVTGCYRGVNICSVELRSSQLTKRKNQRRTVWKRNMLRPFPFTHLYL